jgi:hypothetical protein
MKRLILLLIFLSVLVFKVQSNNFLIVGSAGTNVTDITTVLTALGHTSTLISTTSFNALTSASIKSTYDAVFWTTSLGPTSTSLTPVQNYLDAGGKLVIFYNDILYSWRSTTSPNFATDYLGCSYVSDSGSDGNVTGTGIMTGLSFDISTDPYPDDFNLTGATGIFTAPGGTTYAASIISRNGYRVALFAWNSNYATGLSGSTKNDLFSRIITFLNIPVPTPVPISIWYIIGSFFLIITFSIYKLHKRINFFLSK